MSDKYYYTNEKIRDRELRVIDNEGQNLGVLKTADAIAKARMLELDLVLIGPGAQPPVAKILDFKKFLYEERKKASASKAKTKKSELKEFRIGPTIGDGDLNGRIDRSIEWLKNGDRVKVTAVMKGREAMFPHIAMDKLKKFEEGVAEVAKPEGPAKNMGKMISVTFVAKGK